MARTFFKLLLLAASAVWTMAFVPIAHAVDQGAVVSERIKKLTRAVKWTPVAAIPINFNTYHPQGMVKIGDTYFLSTVDIRKPTTRYAQLQEGYDRDTGEGVGHLFKFDAKGNLIADLTLGEGSVYHPGGIDYDGKWIWAPAAEYRPNSRSIIYRVDPATMKATEVLRYGDHIGGLVYNAESKTLHGVSWGSRRFYRWTFDNDGKVSNAGTRPEDLRVPNRSHYIDYQDCKYLGRQEALCSGLNMYQPKKDGPRFALGGFEIVDLASNQAIYQVPVELWTDSGLPMTYNPFWIEATTNGLRAYFMPEDEKSTLYIYEAEVK
jgi:hypothetical protein